MENKNPTIGYFNKFHKISDIMTDMKNNRGGFLCHLLFGKNMTPQPVTVIPILHSISINSDGHLIVDYDREDYDNMYINNNGHLIATYIDKETGIMADVDLGQVVPVINIGTVTTGSAGSSATATIETVSGTSTLNMTIPKGDTGDVGATGATGARGSVWNMGTVMTVTTETATIYSDSGITSALVNDCYLNTDTGNVYKCVLAGSPTVAKWLYSGSIKGAQGIQGIQGVKGDTGATGANGITPTFSINASGHLIATY